MCQIVVPEPHDLSFSTIGHKMIHDRYELRSHACRRRDFFSSFFSFKPRPPTNNESGGASYLRSKMMSHGKSKLLLPFTPYPSLVHTTHIDGRQCLSEAKLIQVVGSRDVCSTITESFHPCTTLDVLVSCFVCMPLFPNKA